MRTKITLTAVAVTVAIGLALAGGVNVPAWAAAPTYYSVDAASNPPMVIDIRQGSHDNRAQAILYHWHGGNNQRWTKQRFGEDANGHPVYRLVNAESHMCLDKSLDVPDADGNAVYQYGCNGGLNQLWAQVPTRFGRTGWDKLVNQSDGRCLDVDGPNLADGAVLHIWHCYDTWSQRWNIED